MIVSLHGDTTREGCPMATFYFRLCRFCRPYGNTGFQPVSNLSQQYVMIWKGLPFGHMSSIVNSRVSISYLERMAVLMFAILLPR